MKYVMLAAAMLAAAATGARADGDAAAGEKVFKKCMVCHDVGASAKNKVGPELNGIVGRPVASVADYKYSPAMTEFGAGGKVWDAETLHTYLADPKSLVPKTKMAFAGLKKDQEVLDVIAYMNQFNADGSMK